MNIKNQPGLVDLNKILGHFSVRNSLHINGKHNISLQQYNNLYLIYYNFNHALSILATVLKEQTETTRYLCF